MSIHRRKALPKLQNSPDPGQVWLVEHGDLMESALDWMIKAYPKLPDRDRIAKLEEVFRAIEHMGKPVEHMDHTVVDSHMRDLPEPLRDSLRDTMKNGVRTGIPRPAETNQAKATDTAIANFEKVAAEMRIEKGDGSWVDEGNSSKSKGHVVDLGHTGEQRSLCGAS